MSIVIEPIRGQRLRVSGDVEAELTIPAQGDEGRFWIALSDGTLLEGFQDPQAGECLFRMVTESAGIVRFERGGVSLDWRVEWLTLASFPDVAIHQSRPVNLPLFNRIEAELSPVFA